MRWFGRSPVNCRAVYVGSRDNPSEAVSSVLAFMARPGRLPWCLNPSEAVSSVLAFMARPVDLYFAHPLAKVAYMCGSHVA